MAPYKGFPRRRTLAASIGAVLLAFAGHAAALGLGELQPQSYLGEPLSAAVPLLDVRADIAPEDLQVRVLGKVEAAKLGVDLAYMPPGMEVDLDTSSRPWQVRISTPQAVKEPYLLLLVEVTWAKGQVYREYALLLDLPRQGGQRLRPAPARELAPSVPARATLPPPPPPLDTGEPYTVARGDTLWQIAERLRGEAATSSNAELQAWLLANNPTAFIGGDVNRLRAGARLSLPATAGGTTAATGSAPADDNSAARTSAATAAPAPVPAQAPPAPVQTAPSSGTADPGSVDEDERGLLLVGATDRDDKTRELIDMLVRENEALKQRMGELENSEYLTTLKDLVLLQREQIAELRQQLNLPEDPTADQADMVLARIAAGERAELANRTAVAQAGEGSADAGSAEEALVEAAPLAEVAPAGDPLEPQQRSQAFLYGLLALLGAGLVGTAIWLLARRREPDAEDGDAFYPAPAVAPPAPADELPAGPTFSAAAPANRVTDALLRQQVGESSDAANGGLAVSAAELAEIEADLDPIPVKGRPTEVVKRDIARKADDYRAGRSRRAQSLGGLELTEMVDLGGAVETDPEKGIHRAMMLCDFKQFDQARTLLHKLPLARDSRELAEALAEVDARERVQWNKPS